MLAQRCAYMLAQRWDMLAQRWENLLPKKND